MRRAASLAAAVAVLTTACAAGASQGTPAPDRTITLDVRHSRFSPAELEVEPGTTVRFVVRNADPIAHELIVGDQGVQDRHERGTEPHHGDVPGEVSVAAGATATTTYTFSRPGRALFGCHLPGHWDYGMRGLVTVR
ncbi:MAG TPA: plastocyanin/azurin family copper-binding protein [Acidimicrobiales bacterium]|nr:plastocyanin/azurin family copper-binding protein [Acidimicrobiales bacterium]